MSKFRVARFLKRDIIARVSYTTETNIIGNTRKRFEFYPKGLNDEGWYETNDQVLINSLKEQKEQLPYSAQAEEGLKQDNVPYEYAYCASCGGNRVRKLEYRLFEVVE